MFPIEDKENKGPDIHWDSLRQMPRKTMELVYSWIVFQTGYVNEYKAPDIQWDSALDRICQANKVPDIFWDSVLDRRSERKQGT